MKTSSGSSSISHAKISAAKAQLWQQQQEFARYQKLLEGEAVTQQQFENVKNKIGSGRIELPSHSKLL